MRKYLQLHATGGTTEARFTINGVRGYATVSGGSTDDAATAIATMDIPGFNLTSSGSQIFINPVKSADNLYNRIIVAQYFDDDAGLQVITSAGGNEASTRFTAEADGDTVIITDTSVITSSLGEYPTPTYSTTGSTAGAISIRNQTLSANTRSVDNTTIVGSPHVFTAEGGSGRGSLGDSRGTQGDTFDLSVITFGSGTPHMRLNGDGSTTGGNAGASGNNGGDGGQSAGNQLIVADGGGGAGEDGTDTSGRGGERGQFLNVLGNGSNVDSDGYEIVESTDRLIVKIGTGGAGGGGTHSGGSGGNGIARIYGNL